MSSNLQPKVSHENLKRVVLDVVPHSTSSLSATGATKVIFRLPSEVIIGQDLRLCFDAEADGDAGADDSFMKKDGVSSEQSESNMTCLKCLNMWNAFAIVVR